MSKCRTLRIPAALPVCAALLLIRTAPVVAVTNTWYNRLVGDAALPVDQRITRTNVPIPAADAGRTLSRSTPA